MRHIISEYTATGANVRTVCGRITLRGAKKLTPSVNCQECIDNTHKNKSFEETRIGAKRVRKQPYGAGHVTQVEENAEEGDE